MTEQTTTRWVFRAKVLDRAGALTSIASAFSNEGINIETTVGHGAEPRTGVDGSVVVTFQCSRDDKDRIARRIRRLTKVTELIEHVYEAEHLRKSALIQTTRKLTPQDTARGRAHLTCELVQFDVGWYMYFLAGSPPDVDLVLESLGEALAVKDIHYSILSL